jgi:hypothetical protein
VAALPRERRADITAERFFRLKMSAIAKEVMAQSTDSTRSA